MFSNIKKNRPIVSVVFLLLLIVGGFAYYHYAFAVTRTWDGGGTDGTCGGPPGSGNNWSCAANWSGDTVPTGSDIASFDGTSTKNVTINTNISVAGIAIAAGYTGTITQGSTYTVTVGASHWVQAGGTFTGGSGTVDINGTFTLSSGTFTSTSGTFEVGRPIDGETIFTLSGGTFNHNNGTVSFAPRDGCSFNIVFTVDVATSLTLNNVIVNASQACGGANVLTLGVGDTITALGNFIQTDGILGGTWEVQGNYTVGSLADGVSGSGTLTMTGTGAKTYTYTTGGTGAHLRINNAALSVSANTGTTDLKVALFSLLAGTFTAPSGTFEVGRNAGSETIFTLSSGSTFNHNNGTVSFVPTDPCTAGMTYTVDVVTTLTLYNVIFNNIQACSAPSGFTTAVGDTIIVANNFTHTNGYFYGTWEVQGNYTVATTADGGTAGITFTGGNDQVYTDQGGNEPDGDVTINKSGGTVTLASNADWNAASQDLTITAGTLAQSSYNITTTNFTVNGGTYTGGSGTLTTSGPMLVSSGTFTGGSNTVDVNNVFTLSGGTFTSTSGTFELGRQINLSETVLTVSGGTFNHNNGTVQFISEYDGHIYTVDVASTLTLYNIIWNSVGASGSTLTTAAGDTVITANNFTHTNGILAGTWEVQGNVIIGATADGGTGTLTMTGTGSKTYTYTTGGIGPHLRVNNAALSVSANTGTTDLKVHFFSLLSGTFIAPGGTMTLGRQVHINETVLIVSGGTFNHNNGTVQFISEYDGNIYTVDVASTLTLYNVIWNSIGNSGSTLTTAAGDTIIITNNFTHTNGILDGTWEVQGNYTLATTADGGTAGITFTGGNNQTYTDQGGNEPDGDVTINKSGGTVTLASGADWNAASQDLTITAGTLFAPDRTIATGGLTVGASGVLYQAGSQTLTLGGTLSNAGTVKIWGIGVCGNSDTALIRSSTNGVSRSWTGAGTFTIYDADIKDMTGSAAITVYSSTNSGNNNGGGGQWTFSGAACPTVAPPAVNISGLRIQSGTVNIQ